MSGFFDGRLSSLQPYTAGERPENMKNIIKLNTNESPFPPSRKAISAAKKAAKSVNLYCDPTADKLKSALAEDLNVNKKNIAVSNGSDEALAFLFRGFCEKGAVYNDITYGFYKVFASLFGVKSTVIKLDDDFTVPIDAYDAAEGTAFIANPNAPTGIALPLSDIERIASFDENRLVAVDEAYVDFGAESAVGLIGKYPNIAVVRTFSKSRSLAGARLGFIVADERVIADFERVRNSFNPYNVNSVALAMGEAAVRDKKYFEKTRREIIDNRAELTGGLKNLGFDVLPSLANFVFASPPDKDAEGLYERLKSRGILVRHFRGERTGEYLRITVGSKRQVSAFLAAVEELL